MHLPEYFRPISLLNVDYKVPTSVLEARLNTILKYYIHPDQVGFMLERQLQANTRMICNMIYANQNKEPAVMFCDAEKAFDRLQWEFLDSILHKNSFGSTLKNWIEII